MARRAPRGECVPPTPSLSLRDLIAKDESGIVSEWIGHQLGAITMRRDLISEAELREQSRRFLSAVRQALEAGDETVDVSRPEWGDARALLSEFSRTRARQGFSPSETATC